MTIHHPPVPCVPQWPSECHPPQWQPADCDCDTGWGSLQRCWNEIGQFKLLLADIINSMEFSSSAATGTLPPANPQRGALWLNPAGMLMIWDGRQWVSVRTGLPANGAGSGTPLPGVTDGSDAAPGIVGEYVYGSTDDYGVPTAGIAVANSNVGTWYPTLAAQINLSPGDWDITAQANISIPATSVCYEMRIGLTIAAPPTSIPPSSRVPGQFALSELHFNYFGTGIDNAGFQSLALNLAPHRLNTTAPNTVYLFAVINAIPFVAGQVGVWGEVYSRRMR